MRWRLGSEPLLLRDSQRLGLCLCGTGTTPTSLSLADRAGVSSCAPTLVTGLEGLGGLSVLESLSTFSRSALAIDRMVEGFEEDEERDLEALACSLSVRIKSLSALPDAFSRS